MKAKKYNIVGCYNCGNIGEGIKVYVGVWNVCICKKCSDELEKLIKETFSN